MRSHPPGAVGLERRGIYILPSRYGMLFAAVLLLMLIGAINYSNNPGYLIAFLLAGLGLVAMLHTHRNLLGLRVMPGKVSPVFAGEQACFSLRLENPARHLRAGIGVTAGGGDTVVPDLDPRGDSRICVCLPSSKRGELALGRLTLHSQYPLGLFRAWAYVDTDVRCLIYPRPAPPGDLPRVPSQGENLKGDQGAGQDDFAGLRAYRAGDPPRHVHWKSAARDQALRTKQYGGAHDEQLWVDWNALPGVDTEVRLSRLCRYVLTASENRLRYGLRLPGLEIPMGAGEAHRHACLAALAGFGEPS